MPHQLVLDPRLAGLLGRAAAVSMPGPAVRLLGLLALGARAPRRCGSGARPPGAGRVPRRARPRGRRRAAPAPRGCCRAGGRRRTPWRCARSARSGPGLADPVEQVAGAEHVGAEPLVDRRVEGHVAGAVDDRVEVGRQGGHVGEVALETPTPGPPSAPRRRPRPRRSRRRPACLSSARDPGLPPWSSPWAAPARSPGPRAPRSASGAAAPRPTKPVTPVSRTCCPSSRSATVGAWGIDFLLARSGSSGPDSAPRAPESTRRVVRSA